MSAPLRDDTMTPHIRLFNRIASAYRRFFNFQRRMFGPIVARHAESIGAEAGDSFLDIGCGTGALLSVLSETGFAASGIDAAPNMVEAARRSGLPCERGDIDSGLAYPDKSFDFVVASFVAHGLEASLRKKLYAEARRIARKAVVIHDYRGRQSFFMELVERLEGGDYFGFVASAEKELAEAFDYLQIIDVAKTSAWYVGRGAPS